MNAKIKVFAVFLLLLGISPFQALSEYQGNARTADMPVYRYYDRLPAFYSSEIPQSPEDVNSYWGEKYYGNENPDERELFRIDLEIFNLEQREMNVTEAMARSS